ncbi:MAG: hypothetical protein O9325_08840 [Roseomonas sp.]|nr:hypothetical protein [Roseomonas sp.]
MIPSDGRSAEGRGELNRSGNPTPVLQVNDLKKHFPLRGGLLGGTTGYV